LVDQAVERVDAGGGFAAAEHLGAVDVPGGQVGEPPRKYSASTRSGLRGAGPVVGCLRMRAWMEVFSSAEITYSSGRSGVSSKRRPWRSRTPAALAPKSGSRGKVQDRCCQGLIASELSQRQIVVPEIEATMPDSTAARARSGQCQRAAVVAGRPWPAVRRPAP
jgi:hypothetical protein